MKKIYLFTALLSLGICFGLMGTRGVSADFASVSGNPWSVSGNPGSVSGNPMSPEDAVPLTLGTMETANIQNGGDYAGFSFIPAETGGYVFYSDSDGYDTYGYLYDEDMNYLCDDNDSGSGDNFKIVYELEAGKQYYFGARFYSFSHTGSFPVCLEAYDGLIRAEAVGDDSFYERPGTPVTMQVNAVSGGAQITYQWRQEYYDNEADSWNEEPIDGAVSNSYSIDGITKTGSYYCRVTDEYGYSIDVGFYIKVENELSAAAKGDYSVYLEPGESTILEVEASCQEGTLTYQWSHYYYDEEEQTWREDVIDAANNATFSVTSGPRYSEEYHCRISDQFGNSETVWFYVYVENRLQAEAVGDTDITVNPGEGATLQVEASCLTGSLSYQWQALQYNEEYGSSYYADIEGATENTYIIDNNARTCEYVCVVRDQYGNTAGISFSVRINNGLEAHSVDNSDIYVQPNGSATLQVEADCANGSLTYQWRHEYIDEYGNFFAEDIENANTAIYEVNGVTQRETYYCHVSDQYGNSADVPFNVYVENGLVAQSVGDTDIYVEPNGCVTMQVEADCTNGSLSYRWWRDYYNEEYGYNVTEEVEGVTPDTYAAEGITRNETYYCHVSDEYGNSTDVWFYVHIENGLVAQSVGDTDIYVELNGSATMQVTADCTAGSLTYQWEHTTYNQEFDYWENFDIEGADSDTYTATDITEFETYICRVSDQYGNSTYVYFNVHIENGLDVQSVGDTEVYVKPNGSVTLQVVASCNDGLPSYQWWRYSDVGENERIEGAESPTYTVTDVTQYERYYCTVSDQYGNSLDLWFYIYVDSGFQAYPVGETDIYLEPNDSADLQVEVSGVDEAVTYQWHRQYYDPYDPDSNFWPTEIIDGANSDTFTVENATRSESYYCQVSDSFGNATDVWFYIHINSDLQGFAVGEANKYVSLNGSAPMAVEASSSAGNITYQWYHVSFDAGEECIEGANAASYTAEGITQHEGYYCRIIDQYRNTQDIRFDVYVENGLQASSVGETDIYLEPGGSTTLEVVASCTSGNENLTYQWFCQYYDAETDCWQEMHELEGENFPTYAVEGLTQSAYYYCRVSDQYRGFVEVPFNITVSDGGDVLDEPQVESYDENGVLHVTVTYPAYTENGTVRIWSDTSDNVYSYSGEGVYTLDEAVQTGVYNIEVTASATNYRDSVVSTRHIVHAASQLVLPAELDAIEDEAFAGTAVEEVIIPDRCSSVGARAFAGCGLTLIYMPDSVTTIGEQAFDGCAVTFICESENTAFAYAQANGIPCITE